jgi:hypothetical protein
MATGLRATSLQYDVSTPGKAMVEIVEPSMISMLADDPIGTARDWPTRLTLLHLFALCLLRCPAPHLLAKLKQNLRGWLRGIANNHRRRWCWDDPRPSGCQHQKRTGKD